MKYSENQILILNNYFTKMKDKFKSSLNHNLMNDLIMDLNNGFDPVETLKFLRPTMSESNYQAILNLIYNVQTSVE